MVTRIHEIKQYVGLEAEMPTTLPYGDVYFCSDTDRVYKYNASLLPVLVGLGSPAQISGTFVENDETVLLSLNGSKENTDGSGFASNIYGSKVYSKGNSTETVVNIGGNWSKAEHIGSGRTYYIYGALDRGYHNGSGDSTTVAGALSEAKVLGDGVGNHLYVVGNNQVAEINNPNATVDFLQGAHCTIKVTDGDVTDNAMCLILDLDFTGGDISGDFEYLRIQDDAHASTVGGTSRAINSLSRFPSEFGGSIQAAGLINTSITEHADNAAAIAAGLAVGTQYRTGDLLKIVH